MPTPILNRLGRARVSVVRLPGRPSHPARLPRRARRGLINVLLTVAVIAAAMIGILAIYNQVNTSISTSSVQNLVTTMEAEIRRAYASAPQYTGDIDEFIEASLPSSALNGEGADREIVTPWGGAVQAGGGTTPGTDTDSPNRFWILVAGLPERACESLANAFLDLSSVQAIQTGTGRRGNLAARTDSDEISDGCAAADNNRVAVIFRG